MPEKTTHPSQAELSAYNLGQLPPDQAAAIENHISECEPCCETIIGMSSDDTFVALLQEARQLPTDQTLDSDGSTAKPSSSSRDIPAPLAEHPRYEIVGLIGKGGMGDVYKARHRMMERTVALKIINRELVRKPEAVDRFHREVKTAARLSHPNIVTAYDAEQAGDVHFLVMEYVDGVDLSQIIKDRGPLLIAEACDCIRQAAIGLQYAHECGMVHRDIKPHNLMVMADGTVKILDFGLASLAPEALSDADSVEAHGDLTAAGAIMGTPDFISPEQAEDARSADIRSDIYSLGATLYFLLSGRPLFADGSVMHKLKSHAQAEPEPLEHLRDDIPDDLAAVVFKMIAKNPAGRFQTPAEVAVALQSFVPATPDRVLDSADQPQLRNDPPRRRPRRRMIAGGALAAAALLFALSSITNETVADKLAKLKTPAAAQWPNQVPPENAVASVYNVEGEALDGNTAAICDLGNCRIALLGQDITETRDCIDSLFLTVSGPRQQKLRCYASEALHDEDKAHFTSDYSNGEARCRFYDFRFRLTDQVIRYGKVQHIWNDPSSPGQLILVDTVSGVITTKTMQPQSDRGTVPGLVVLGSEQPRKTTVAESDQPDASQQSSAEDRDKLRVRLLAALSQAAGIPSGQWESVAKSPTASTAGIDGDPLSHVLLKLNPEEASKTNPAVLKDFQLIGGMPKPSDLSKAMSRSQHQGYVSMLQPPDMSGLSYERIADDEESAKLIGSVRFHAKGLYAGVVEFVAEVADNDELKVTEFKLPNYGLSVQRSPDGSWESQEIQAASNVADHDSQPLNYDLSQVPANSWEVYGFRPRAIHTDGRFVNLWNALQFSPLAHAIDENLAQVVLVRLPCDDGAPMRPVSIMTVSEGDAKAFAFRSLSGNSDIPESISPWTYFPARQPDQFFRIVDKKTVVMGTRDVLDAHAESLKREPNAEILKVAASMQDGPLFVIGNSSDKRFLEVIKEQGREDPLAALLMSHIPLWQDTKYLTMSLTLGERPQLHCAGHALAPEKQQAITQTLQLLPVSLANLIRSVATIGKSPLDTASTDALITALNEAEVVEPSDTETRLMISLKEAEPHLFKMLNAYFDLQRARSRAFQAASANNLKEIGMGILLFEQEHGYLPSVSTKLPGVEHPVSWRVAILKYLDGRLYRQYNLAEPWDSENNKKLLDELPGFYRHHGQEKGITDTCYVTLVGESTATGSGGATTHTSNDISDGPQQTIFVTEGYTRIPWTKPEDLMYDEETTLPTLHPEPEGWNVLFGDGSVQFISSETPVDALRALITRNGGEKVVSRDGVWTTEGIEDDTCPQPTSENQEEAVENEPMPLGERDGISANPNGATMALADVVLERDFGDLKFKKCEIVSQPRNERTPEVSGLMFVFYEDAAGREVSLALQRFRDRRDLQSFFESSRRREEFERGEFDGEPIWRVGNRAYSWTDDRHYLLTIGGSVIPRELVQAYLEVIPSRLAEFYEAPQKKPLGEERATIARQPEKLVGARAVAYPIIEKRIGDYVFDHCQLTSLASDEQTGRGRHANVRIKYYDPSGGKGDGSEEDWNRTLHVTIDWFEERSDLEAEFDRLVAKFGDVQAATKEPGRVPPFLLRTRYEGDEHYFWSDGSRLITMREHGSMMISADETEAYVNRIPSIVTRSKTLAE